MKGGPGSEWFSSDPEILTTIKKELRRSAEFFIYCQGVLFLGKFDVNSVETFAALLQFKGYFVVLFNLVDQTCGVDEILLVRIQIFNEPKSFGYIKEFYFTVFHWMMLLLKCLQI